MDMQLPNGPDYLYLLLILYGSRRRDSVDDDRYGDHQRRVEVDIRLKLPRVGMTPMEISQIARMFCGQHYQSIKHTQRWYCEFCNKPARMSQTDTLSWAHLTPPRVNLYFHFVCDPRSGRCADLLKAAQAQVALMSGMPRPRSSPVMEDPAAFPPMAACAGCEKEETKDMSAKKCSACNLTRYCSAASLARA